MAFPMRRSDGSIGRVDDLPAHSQVQVIRNGEAEVEEDSDED